MKLTKGFWTRMAPAAVLVVITWLLSILVYNSMLNAETETCWERLENATHSTAQKIDVRMTDNISFLDAVSESYIMVNHLEHQKEAGAYLDSVWSKTIFERIDVIMPDNTLLTQSGEVINTVGNTPFEELVAKGSHITKRETSPFSGKEVFYYITPIERNNEVIGMLCGTLDCETFSEIFEVYTYRGKSQLFLIDQETGDYLMDTWHDSLGNVSDAPPRRIPDSDETLDMAAPILAGESTRMVFISRTNNLPSYQYTTSIDKYGWTICVALQEDVVFSNLNNLRSVLLQVGLLELLLICAFVTWNIVMTVNSLKNEKKANELELTRVTNEAKARFISNMSHDIRTPLNGIVGMLHIIRKHRDDELMVDDCLDKIGISAQYLSTLASDMLDINEIESDKLILENEQIDLRNMADKLGVLIEPKANEAGVKYHIDCSKLQNPRVTGSPVHIERVLVNLIGNAIKYSKSEGGEIWFSIDETNVDGNCGTYCFTIRDNGIGMSEDFQKNMYNAFAQERVGARSDYQGYGLGLTIVYRLVEKMNGKIELESSKGEGSTFKVIIPLTIDKSKELTEQIEDVAADLNGVNILLVEDNEFNMEIADVILTDAGAKVVMATNGRSATEIFETSEPNYFDLILMDIMMPEMDGIEATKIIRKMLRGDAKTIPIFAMTAHTFSEEIQRCKDAGMNEHIAKPLDIDKLILQVSRYCKKPNQNKAE